MALLSVATMGVVKFTLFISKHILRLIAKHEPLYDVRLGYFANEQFGPFGGYAFGTEFNDLPLAGQAPYDFFGTPVAAPFGVGAGPLPGPHFVEAALRAGYPIVTYKSVRTGAYPCHPFPGVLPVKLGRLDPAATDRPIVVADGYSEPLAIANSFGIPSYEPSVWQPRIERALGLVRPGEAVLVAFQGTDRGQGRQAFIDDHVRGVGLLAQTGAKTIEVNLSCPNEGSPQLLCFDTATTLSIILAIRQAVRGISLIVKLTYFTSQDQLRELVRRVGPHVDGITAINTVGARVVGLDGRQAFPGDQARAKPGISGRPIKHLGLDMVRRLAGLRQEFDLGFRIIGIGGVLCAADFHEYLAAGADIVMSVTGAMWQPGLAREVRASLAAPAG